MMLIIILTISSTVFSQSATDTSQKIKKDTTHYKCFPVPIVKKITQDLLRLDSCKENLNKTNEELSEVYKKITLKDSVINDMKIKEVNFNSIIEKERIKNELSENRVKKLEMDLTVQKVKGKITTILSGGFIAVLVTMMILKR
jgi:hypothetical protein